GLEIDAAVADDVGARQVDAVLGRRLADHPGSRLAAIAIGAVRRPALLRMVRAVVDRVEPGPAVPGPGEQAIVYLLHQRLAEVAARHPGLVGGHDRQEAGAIDQADRLEASGKEPVAREMVDVADLLADRAVTVHEDGPRHGALRSTAPPTGDRTASGRPRRTGGRVRQR